MNIKDTIGIDMSKLTFNAFIHSDQVNREFDNVRKDHKQLIDWAYKNSDRPNREKSYFFVKNSKNSAYYGFNTITSNI